MPAFSYEGSPDSPWLRQGEILRNFLELRLKAPANARELVPIRHAFVAVVTADCDLEWDYKERFVDGSDRPAGKLLPEIAFCDLATRDFLKETQGVNSSIWTRIKSGQNERYYLMETTQNLDPRHAIELPELVADFKSTFSVPTDVVYDILANDEAERVSWLPSPVSFHFIQRYYNYHSRIGLE